MQDEPTEATRLADILRAENAALAAFDLSRAAALLAAKTRAAEAFEVACAAWPDPGSISVQLAQLAADNRRLLCQAIIVQGRVIEIVTRAIPRALQQASPGPYGARGTPKASRLPAITLFARA